MINHADCQNKNDAELVKLALQNEDYFLCLMKKYQAPLLRYIMRISDNSKEDAEDILQEVFLKTYKNLNDYNPGQKFSSWIYRICHNEVISHWRKKKARASVLSIEDNDEFLKNIAGDFDLEKQVYQHFAAEDIKRNLAQLEPKYQEVLVLRYLEEQSYEEISDILHKPPGTVATLINRAKNRLKYLISKENK